MPDTSSEEIIHEVKTSISRDVDVILACHKARALATTLAFTPEEHAALTIAISEVARNIVKYAGQGQMVLRRLRRGEEEGICVIAYDKGPGIPDVDLALQDGYTTGSGLGMGLSGAKRLMDEFEIDSKLDEGTMIVMKKWKRK